MTIEEFFATNKALLWIIGILLLLWILLASPIFLVLIVLVVLYFIFVNKRPVL